jgi:DDE superfamily endonuclease
MGLKQSEFFCVEDNSKVHGKKATKLNEGLCNKARLECGIYSIDWPPKSPDLNPIEHCWRFIKQRLRNRKPDGGWTLPELTKAVMEIWAKELTKDYFNKWIDSMLGRLEAVIARNMAE